MLPGPASARRSEGKLARFSASSNANLRADAEMVAQDRDPSPFAVASATLRSITSSMTSSIMLVPHALATPMPWLAQFHAQWRTSELWFASRCSSLVASFFMPALWHKPASSIPHSRLDLAPCALPSSLAPTATPVCLIQHLPNHAGVRRVLLEFHLEVFCSAIIAAGIDSIEALRDSTLDEVSASDTHRPHSDVDLHGHTVLGHVGDC